VVLEPARTRRLHARRQAAEEVRRQSLVRVADVLRHERQDDPPPRTPGGRVAGEHVEQGEERALGAGGDDEIVRRHGPAEFAAEERGQRVDELEVSLRRVVVEQGPVDRGAVVEQLAHAAPPHGLHLRDRGRASAAEHEHASARHRAAEVVHQPPDAGGRAKPFAEP